MTDGSGTETSTYDTLDRLTAVTRGANTFSYAYDLANPTQVTYPGSTSVAYGFDDDERLQSVVSGGQTTSYAYDEAANLRTTTLPSGNGYVETRTYDRAGRLVDIESKKGATTLSRFTIAPDLVGNPLSVVRSGSLAQTQTYSYDNMDRLTSVCFQAGTCPGASDPFIRWSYDGVGNRLTEARPAGTTSYTYNAADELTQAGSAAYTYDQNGNELSAGSRTFGYDLANRVQTTTSGNTTTTYLYDGEGKRLQASTGTQALKKTNFLWDANRSLPQLALERDGNNSPIRTYRYGTRRISQTAGSNTSYFIHDGLGSVANLTSSSGATQWTWSYEPFGAIRTETKANGNQPDNLMRFTGEYLDPTGLYHLRARQYDSESGRFLTRDLVPPSILQPHVGRFVYVSNRPTVLLDPLGLLGLSLCAQGEVSFFGFVSGKVCLHATVSSEGLGVGTSHTISGGVGLKVGLDAGGSVSLSDARCISDYEGESYSGGVAVGAGGIVDVSYQRGPNASGREINEFTVGGSLGLAGAGGPHFERNITTLDRSIGAACTRVGASTQSFGQLDSVGISAK